MHRGSAFAGRFAALALVALVVGAGAAVSACSGEKCVGGKIIDGECQAECERDKCREGNTCVNNQCMLMCDSHADCYVESQDCAPAVEDGTGAPIMVCTTSDKQLGFGRSCPFNVECDDFGVCPDGGRCSGFACGGDPAACVRDEAACGSDESCTYGTCTGDGAPCTASACSSDQCTLPLTCLSAGEGDAEAYCTQHGCASDAECPQGYYCGVVRVCSADPQQNPNCGTGFLPCMQSSRVGAEDLRLGSACTVSNTCIKRTQCAPCTTDLDCSYAPGQLCVPLGEGNICARACSTDGDCDPDHACNNGACLPRFGACKGQGGFCEPCMSDEDCGGPGSTMACVSLSGNMRACFDLSFPSCTSDADCPAAPSGKRGTCMDEGEGYAPGDSIYQRCFLPYSVADNKTSCW